MSWYRLEEGRGLSSGEGPNVSVLLALEADARKGQTPTRQRRSQNDAAAHPGRRMLTKLHTLLRLDPPAVWGPIGEASSLGRDLGPRLDLQAERRRRSQSSFSTGLGPSGRC